MVFQIKSFRSIAASMINVTRSSQSRITDFSVGAVARTLMESPAVEIEELYLQMLLGLQDAIPTAIYQAIGFDTIDALPSAGLLTIYFQTPLISRVVIPAATLFEAPARSAQFYSTSAITADAGSLQVAVPVVSAQAGLDGNVGQNEITRFVNFSAFSDAFIRHAAFTGGREAESELDRKTRFIGLINALSRGTLMSLDYAARYATVKSTSGVIQEYVTRVGVIEYPGQVNVYIYGSSGLPSPALLKNAQAIIDGGVNQATGIKTEGYRSAGVRVTALPTVERRLSFGLTIGTFDASQQNAALVAAIDDAVSRTLMSVPPGDALLVGRLMGAVLGLSGVRSCSADISNNIICAQSEVLMAGSINMTWLPNA